MSYFREKVRHAIVGHSRWDNLRHFLASLVFVALGILVLAKKGPTVVAWFGILFFGSGCLIFLYQLVTGRCLRNNQKHKDKITFDESGFGVTRGFAVLKSCGGQTRSMPWSKVNSVFAFKRDLFIVDCICVFLARENGTGIEVDEEMEGWEEFSRALSTYLPGCIAWEKWYLQVSSPAFATNLTEIFSRKADESGLERGEAKISS